MRVEDEEGRKEQEAKEGQGRTGKERPLLGATMEPDRTRLLGTRANTGRFGRRLRGC